MSEIVLARRPGRSRARGADRRRPQSRAVRAAAEEAGCQLLFKPVGPGALRALVGQLLTQGRRNAG
ncbi:MAG TPA: hypothetical protein VD978_23530 [Azospirillum sp.]|nr:hypothetical protein [Azospirillum sp.]